jgi:hypothetical protein
VLRHLDSRLVTRTRVHCAPSELICARRFFSNWPVILTALSIVYFLVTRLARLILPSAPTKVTSSTLTSPTGDSNLSKLESDVIISALASNLLPLDPSGKRISPSEAAEDIQDFKNAEPKDIKRWRRVAVWRMPVQLLQRR